MAKFVQVSMKDRLAAEIRSKILSGELRPKTRLTEQMFADEYGISRSVVREAMLVLELQGLIVSIPYKGSEVASVSREEVENLLLPVRVQVEQFALRTALENYDAAYFARFDRVLDDMQQAVASGNVEAFNEADIRFHALIVGAADSETVQTMWEAIHMRIRMHLALQTGRTGALEQFLQDHRALVEVLRTGDAEESARMIEEHIIGSNRPFLRVFDEEQGA